ncbi:MAG: hypothetical protein ACRDOJ_01530 [Nocardioidaceae bacterium]
MDFAYDLLVFVHLLGMAALFGGAVVQVRADEHRVNSAMLHGVLTQVVSGLLLVGVLESGTEPVDHAKIGVKFALAVLIAVLVLVNRRKPSIPRGLFFGLFGLTTVTIGVAVFW